MATLRIGVVGLHFGAQVHVPAFRSDARCEVVAVAGLDFDKATRIARDLSVPSVFDDWRALVTAPSVDAVSIAVPPAMQPDVIIEAARCRKHVFCEKPLASSLTAARAALTAVETAGVVHGIDFLFPELPLWQQAKALLAEGVIGRPAHFAYTWRVETYASRTKSKNWKTSPDQGGGALANFGSHVLHDIEWLLGPVRAIEGFTCARGARTGCAVDGVVSLDGGATGTISISTDAFMGSGHVVEIYGEAGTLVLRNAGADYARGFTLHVATRQSPALVSVSDDQSGAHADGRLAPVTRLAGRFVDAVIRGATMTPNLTHGVRSQELLSSIASACDVNPVSHATAS